MIFGVKGERHRNVNEGDSDDDLDCFHSNLCGVLLGGQISKDKLSQICDILDINCKLLKIPRNGFTKDAIDNEV